MLHFLALSLQKSSRNVGEKSEQSPCLTDVTRSCREFLSGAASSASHPESSPCLNILYIPKGVKKLSCQHVQDEVSKLSSKHFFEGLERGSRDQVALWVIRCIDDRKLLTGRETEACSVKWGEERPVHEDGEKPQAALTGQDAQGLASCPLSGSLLKVTGRAALLLRRPAVTLTAPLCPRGTALMTFEMRGL